MATSRLAWSVVCCEGSVRRPGHDRFRIENMTATLTLTPLSSEECIALLLKKKGRPPTAHPVPVEELERVRNAITLTLCTKPIIGE